MAFSPVSSPVPLLLWLLELLLMFEIVVPVLLGLLVLLLFFEIVERRPRGILLHHSVDILVNYRRSLSRKQCTQQKNLPSW